jgi:hypothetical protein
MRWRRNWSVRPARPQVRRLSADEQKKVLAQMAREIARSPVLSGFAVQVRFLRGRFYIERALPSGVEVWGHITPLADLVLNRLDAQQETAGLLLCRHQPQMLRDPNAHTTVRWEVVKALAEFGPAVRDALPALQRCVRDPEPSVRMAAEAALSGSSLWVGLQEMCYFATGNAADSRAQNSPTFL